MNPTRRTMLGASAAALTATLAACSRSSDSPDTSGTGSGTDAAPTGTLQWWDHFEPLESALTGLFEDFATAGGGEVERTVYNPNEMGQALQLALGSDQMPDVFSNLTDIPAPALVSRELVGAVTLDSQAQSAAADLLFEGMHTFDGAVYSIPLFSHQQHSSLTWFDLDQVERAGGDPEAMTITWEEFRRLARAITANGDMPAWVGNLAFTDRLEEQIVDLAQAAGRPLAFNTAGVSAPDVTDPATGDYVFNSEEFIEALEFLASLIADGVMLGASTSLDARDARARWAAGDAAIFFDGPWNPGVLSGQFPDFLPQVSVTNLPSPDGHGYTARGPSSGQFWMSATSGHVDGVGTLFSLLTRPEFSTALASNMDQPPVDLAAVADADVDPTYTRAIDIFTDWCRLAPSPLVRNPAVGEVIAQMEEIRPSLGEIVQGYLGGNIDDASAALTTFNDAISAERDRAIDAVTSDGLEVSLADWEFSGYELGADYGPDRY
ncbi:extracellular solute-binding protein [Ruania alkalisoli]|uniref:Extracellular solute-binding protein n=1 Tax=Ruania alkalisoli TaxID=2779775 RepID=A0A7M1SPV6_9MICO|nr:extracellular solute-binding protein [Ruania alkalisoli]QOR69505.1 extracellular solute-binding protein [Ruania alkalisoli]